MIVLGAPLAESENPFLATPLTPIEAEIGIRECTTPLTSISPAGTVTGLLESYTKSLVEGLGGGLCVDVEYRVAARAPPSGVYAAVSTLIVHALARYHGDTLAPWEILEVARLADPMEKPSGWHYVLDALRYSVITGKTIVYRNEEEYGEIAAPLEGIEYKETLGPARQRLTRQDLGPDPYNALVHLVGVSVLEGAVRVREGQGPGSLRGIAKLLTAISSTLWGLTVPGDCSLSPGLPGQFEVVCWVD